MRLPEAARLLGHRVLGPIPVRVRGGPNRGRRWSLASLGRGFASGRFERDRMTALSALVRPGECFWDVGAHRGYVSLAASRAVGPTGEVISIEPSQENLRFLSRHLRWNEASNVRVIATALGDEVGQVRFGGPGSSVAFRMGRGPELVPVTTAELLVRAGTAPPPSFMKIDVEGAEVAVLRGAEALLGGEVAALISVHSRELYTTCREVVEEHGFRTFESADLAARERRPHNPWIGDTDFLAIGPDRALDESAVRSLAIFAP